MTSTPGVSPGMLVFDCVVVGVEIHVFPPSVLYCHSCALAPLMVLATTCTTPETVWWTARSLL